MGPLAEAPRVKSATSARCHQCGTIVPEPESKEHLPSINNPAGQHGITAHVSIYNCGCGRKFTTIEYERAQPPPLSFPGTSDT